MNLRENFAVALFFVGAGLCAAPVLPEFLRQMQQIRAKFMELDPGTVLPCFGILFLCLGITLSILSLVERKERLKTTSDEPTIDINEPRSC